MSLNSRYRKLDKDLWIRKPRVFWQAGAWRYQIYQFEERCNSWQHAMERALEFSGGNA